MYVCPYAHAILAVYIRGIKSIMKDTIVLSIIFTAILKQRFSSNCLIRKFERFYLPRQGRPSSVDAYSPCAMFRILSVTCLLTRKALRLINPRRTNAERVTVVVSCVCVSVCLSVCLSQHAILAVRAIRSITKYAIVLSVRFAAILKRRFS